MKKKQILKTLFAGAFLGVAGLALANQVPPTGGSPETADLNVLATVTPNCTLQGATLDFGNYNPLPGNAQDAQTTIAVTCTNTTQYLLSLDNGLNGTGQGVRQLSSASSGALTYLSYQLYQDNGYTNIWGTAGSEYVGTGTGSEQDIPVYGQILANQTSAVPGSYTDTVTITLNFPYSTQI